jgi:cytochrome c553
MKASLAAAVAGLLLALAGCGGPQPAGRPPPPQFDVVAGVSQVGHGERLARVLGCTGCHGHDLTGHAWIEDPRQAILFTSNLTRAVPLYSDAQLARAIRWGVRPDRSVLWEMPSDIFTHLSEPDMAALIAWLRTVPPSGEPHPRIRIGPEGRRLIETGEIKPAPVVARENRGVWPVRLDGRHEWARYMIRATCAECHGLDLTGREGNEEHRGPPDLVVVAGYSRDEFRRLMRTGAPIGGREMPLMSDVARGRFVHFTDREVDAIYDYLAARARQPQ